MKARYWAVATLAAGICLSFACSNSQDIAGHLEPEPSAAPSFTDQDAAPSINDDGGLINYCPATSCPAPFTSCPGSQFPCDVNLMTDPNNCGSCGFVCPTESYGLHASFTCNAGKCVMLCTDRNNLDCNGLVDDGCETPLRTNDNCNGCGDKCPDPAKPCVWNSTAQTGTCGCPDPSLTFCSPTCVDTKTSDANCGTCGHSCNGAAGDGGTAPPNAYFGCLESECGQVKCKKDWADCDGKKDNGCEADMFSPTSCGGCGIVCDPGQVCAQDPYGRPTCMCPAGKTRCGVHCVDLSVDPFHCGTCDIDCTVATHNHGTGLCNYGSCTFGCSNGWGDCNANPNDGCETNFESDPRNCGGCGVTCDLASGQPCIAGRCAVEPCSITGGTTK